MKFITNSVEIDMELQHGCSGDRECQELVEGMIRWAARYPCNLRRAICKGLLLEKRNDVQQLRCLFKIYANDTIQENEFGNIESRERGIKHEDEGDVWTWDDVTGEQLNSKEVYKARLKEMQYVKRKGI